MKPGALLVNTARAELIAPGALERVLAEGRIAAALDVFETEPLAAASALRDLPNVILSPHQGYNTPESLERMLDVVVANIEHYLSGAPLNIVSQARVRIAERADPDLPGELGRPGRHLHHGRRGLRRLGRAGTTTKLAASTKPTSPQIW